MECITHTDSEFGLGQHSLEKRFAMLTRAQLASGIRKIVWNVDIPYQHSSAVSIHVDLGAGNAPRNPFNASRLVATDMHKSFIRPDGVEFVVADLTRPLPFDSNSISSVSAYDVLEHIPRWERVDGEIHFPFIELMSEIHRCLIPDGLFIAVTPAFPNSEAFQDPTHVNIISKGTIRYFAAPEPWAALTGYGFVGSFQVIAQTWLRGAGPFAADSLVSSFSQQRKFEKIRTLFRILNRMLIASRNRKPTHLLWVLAKP
jgi:SAM-dependent methyltransferase